MATSKSKTVETVTKPLFTTVTVNEPLVDVSLQSEMFVGQPAGRYVINYVTQFSSQSLSVMWDGETLSL